MKAARELSKWHCSLSDLSPTYSTTTQLFGLPQPGECLRLRPLQHNSCSKTKKYGPNERTDQTPKIEVSDEEIATLSDAEFKTLVIRILTEMVEYGHKMEEKMKAVLSEINKNVQGTNSDGKETGTQINDLDQKDSELNIHPEENEETGIQKNEERLRNLRDNFNCSNI